MLDLGIMICVKKFLYVKIVKHTEDLKFEYKTEINLNEKYHVILNNVTDIYGKFLYKQYNFYRCNNIIEDPYYRIKEVDIDINKHFISEKIFRRQKFINEIC
jgi:hypothetical protein